MYRRRFLQSISLLPAALLLEARAQAQSVSPEMKSLATDGWQWQIPADWREHEDSKLTTPIFQSPDEKKMCLFFALPLPWNNRVSPVEMAMEMRARYQRSMEQMVDFKWRVMQETIASTSIGVVQTLDLFNAENKARRLQRSIITRLSLGLLALHDDSCESHPASVAFFAPILESFSPA